MAQNGLRSQARQMAWRVLPAPVLNLMFGARLRGMGQLIEDAGVVRATEVTIPGILERCFRLDLRDGTAIVSTAPLPNNVKITHAARSKLKLGPEYAKALVDLIVRYKYPHALVPVLTIPVPDQQRGGFHLQHRKLPQETGDFDATERAFLLSCFTPQPGWSILDIGCYLGHGTTRLAQIVGDTGHILAVEAVPINASIAEYQVQINGLQNARVLNRAIWRVAGQTIAMNRTENQANAIADDVIASQLKIDVATTSIAELTGLLGGAADLVSMTVNGAEVEAIDSLADLSLDLLPHRMIMPGWYPSKEGQRFEIISAKLKQFGYRVLVTQHGFVIAWLPKIESA